MVEKDSGARNSSKGSVRPVFYYFLCRAVRLVGASRLFCEDLDQLDLEDQDGIRWD